LQAPGTVAAAYGTSERYLTQNHLNYTASEVHSSFGPLFGQISPEDKVAQIEKINKKFAYLQEHMLKDKTYLVGDKFSIADSYLYIVVGWGRYVGVDISPYPVLEAYWTAIDQLPVVQEAHAKMATDPSRT
jgi:glutathione S-transferase